MSESSEQASGDPYHEQNGWTVCRLIKRHDYSLDSLYYYYYIKRYGYLFAQINESLFLRYIYDHNYIMMFINGFKDILWG